MSGQGSGALELRSVSKRYVVGAETVRAVDGLSLSVAGGELVALYGPSGSGKTTTLLLAAAILDPDSGSVVFDGRDIGRLSETEAARYRRREVGFIFQGFHLLGSSSVLDNATLKLASDGFSVNEARDMVWPWLERLGLAERATFTTDRLSKGERQRIAIARALVNNPRLILADEPTGNLDSEQTAAVFALLRDLCRERGIPGLLVTHDSAALSVVDRAYTLRDGCAALQAEKAQKIVRREVAAR